LLGQWFSVLSAQAGHPGVTVHRLRHTVATTLVSRGDILQAEYRLGHRDAATASHAFGLPASDRSKPRE